ncbi:MAG: hypothetical protein HZA03_03880 [Nitrospinae bacterium]|nr:hypothetical protein [Nitrospinota bacterium]
MSGMNWNKAAFTAMAALFLTVVAGDVSRLAPGGSGHCGLAFAAEEMPIDENDLKDEFTREPNYTHLNRISGLLADLLGRQRMLYEKSGKTEPNEVSERAEEMINEANLLAAERKYGEGTDLLRKAYELIAASLHELKGTGGGSPPVRK